MGMTLGMLEKSKDGLMSGNIWHMAGAGSVGNKRKMRQANTKASRKRAEQMRAAAGGQMSNGLASSMVFTPVQGMELVNPDAMKDRVKEANSAILEPVEDNNNLETSMDNETFNTDRRPSSGGNDGNNDGDNDGDDDLDKAMKAAEDMLTNDAHDKLKDLGVGDVDEVDNFDSDALETNISTCSSSNKDVVSEFEDMLADADKELEELMGS